MPSKDLNSETGLQEAPPPAKRAQRAKRPTEGPADEPAGKKVQRHICNWQLELACS